MAKRLSDTDKWKKPFLRTLKAPYKLLWLYILDECDHAGIWCVDFAVAQLKIGEKLKEQEALSAFTGKIFVFDHGHKWFIFDFIEFQYGTLNPTNRVHNSVLTILQKHGIDHQNKPLISPLQGAKDKDKDKEKDKDTKGEVAKILPLDEPPVIYRQFDHLKITNAEVQELYDLGYTQIQVNTILDEIQNYKKNSNYKSLYLTAKKWLQKVKPNGTTKINQTSGTGTGGFGRL